MNKNKKIIVGFLIVVLLIAIGVVIAVENTNSNLVQTLNHEQNEHTFWGKVIESDPSYIIVEPNENEEIRKSADKISIGLNEYNDSLYMVGANVKITYHGIIMDSYPAQVEATKIEMKSAENFEIIFYDKHSMENNKIYTILDKSETDNYNYTIYGYAGNVNIRIDGKEYFLKEALSENKITMDEIIVKANQDEKDGNKDLKLTDVI